MQHFIQPPGCRFTAFTCLSSAPTIHAQLQNWQHISYSSCSTVNVCVPILASVWHWVPPMGGCKPIHQMVTNTPTVLCLSIHCPWQSNGLVPGLLFRRWQSQLWLPKVHLYSTLPSVQLSSLLWSILHLPYPGLHPPTRHTYPQQNTPNQTTASSSIKTKAHVHMELTAGLFTNALAGKVVGPPCLILPQQVCLRLHYTWTTALLPA